jgi:hypothetical protein
MFTNIPIYWINLERSKDRRTKMEDQLNKYNIKNHKRIMILPFMNWHVL